MFLFYPAIQYGSKVFKLGEERTNTVNIRITGQSIEISGHECGLRGHKFQFVYIGTNLHKCFENNTF